MTTISYNQVGLHVCAIGTHHYCQKLRLPIWRLKFQRFDNNLSVICNVFLLLTHKNDDFEPFKFCQRQSPTLFFYKVGRLRCADELSVVFFPASRKPAIKFLLLAEKVFMREKSNDNIVFMTKMTKTYYKKSFDEDVSYLVSLTVSLVHQYHSYCQT